MNREMSWWEALLSKLILMMVVWTLLSVVLWQGSQYAAEVFSASNLEFSFTEAIPFGIALQVIYRMLWVSVEESLKITMKRKNR